MTLQSSRTLATALCAVAAAAALAACNRPATEPSAGRQVDAAVAQMERKADDARQAVDGAATAVADKVKDATITTMINAELARDSQLSALRVDVDTVEGRVTLRGSAPDVHARERATQLAQRVDGVKSVDNQLSIRANS